MNNLILKASQYLGLPPFVLINLINTASHRYKVYQIKKRTQGFRTIAQPAKPIKAIQRFLIDEIFSELPVHDTATAYKKGASIKENALRHSSQRFILKMDFSDFFPSIRINDVKMHLRRWLPDIWTEEEINLMARVCLWKPKTEGALRLSIGAPSSPLLSNSIMFEFDCLINEYCENRGVTYTRYADDLCFSTNHSNILIEVEAKVSQILQQINYPKLRVNERKTVHASMKKRRFITGIIINNEGNISLGRERKREIRAKIHNASLGKLENLELVKLRGLISYANDIEPEFINKLEQKYGRELFESIKKLM